MKKKRNMIIAIDGYSSTGKSTLAKNLARELGYVYVDTGSMYRAVALYAMRNGLTANDELMVDALIETLDQIELDFVYNPEKGFSEIYLNGEKVEGLIRSLEVSNQVSQVARIPQVRKKLVMLQQNMAGDKGIVMDGRDIGTVVFPNADLKIFLTASPETRAKRRYKEMVDDDREISYESVLENVSQRDLMDTTRKDSPLVKAEDAVEIDNSHMNVQETFDTALELVSKVQV
ncbi:MAG: (d)CMP kinase [Lutimonas sp.]